MNTLIKGPGQIQIGEVYSNDLTPRYLEHRKVIGFELGLVQYEIVHGKRTGSKGSCTREAFWCWQRMLVVRAGRAVDDRDGVLEEAGETERLQETIGRLEATKEAESRQIARWLRELARLRHWAN
jgi:hypothetical protein